VSKPAHTAGPLGVHNTWIYSGNDPISGTVIAETKGDSVDKRTNARLLAAAYNAFDSAGKKLGLNAVLLAEALADGGIAQLVEAVRAAKEMSDWFMEHSRQADHAHSELKQPLHETAGWKELVDSGYNGLMASYQQQFEEALAKVKGGAT
jgi:hypothetical protein